MSSKSRSLTDDTELERDKRLNELLEETLDLPADEREPYLEHHCSDPLMRREVLDLLDEDLGDFLEEPAAASPVFGDELSRSPLALIPLCYFAGLALRRGDYETACELLEKAEQTQVSASATPSLQVALMHRNLGRTYQALKRPLDARAQYEKAIRLLEALAPSRSHRKELDQARFELGRLQGLADGESLPQSVHDFLS